MEKCKTCKYYIENEPNGLTGMCKYCRDGENYKKKDNSMKVKELIDRECLLKKEELDLDNDWDTLANEFLDRPYVSEFLKMHNASILNFDYLDMQFDEYSWRIDLYVWWGNCSEKELICSLDPKDLDRFMTDDNYMIDLLKEKAAEEEKREQEREEKKKAARYEMYQKLKEEFDPTRQS